MLRQTGRNKPCVACNFSLSIHGRLSTSGCAFGHKIASSRQQACSDRESVRLYPEISVAFNLTSRKIYCQLGTGCGETHLYECGSGLTRSYEELEFVWTKLIVGSIDSPTQRPSTSKSEL